MKPYSLKVNQRSDVNREGKMWTPKIYLSVKTMRTSKNCPSVLWKLTWEHSFQKNGWILVIIMSFVATCLFSLTPLLHRTLQNEQLCNDCTQEKPAEATRKACKWLWVLPKPSPENCHNLTYLAVPWKPGFTDFFFFHYLTWLRTHWVQRVLFPEHLPKTVNGILRWW